MDQDKINQLRHKIDLLQEKHESFSKEIEELKKELRQISLSESAIQSIPSQIKEAIKVPDAITDDALQPIRSQIDEVTEGVSKNGNQFIKFQFENASKNYWAWFFSNGRFAITEGDSKEFVSKGNFENGGQLLAVVLGNNKDRTYTGENILDSLKEISTVNESSVAAPIVAAEKPQIAKAPKSKSGLEKYIGENILTVIGIVVIIIGVIFGVKYSIDHELISPLTRVILGYVLGVGILGIGIKLKKKYEQFSAVLVSGSMAIMYFLTFAAYSFYDLIPQLAAFSIMVFFTLVTVVASISYNRQIIAHIGLVGSYAIPFLLSNNSGNVTALFTYMAIINAGILVIAFKKYWKYLFYSAMGFTWLIYWAWFMTSYHPDDHFQIALIFNTAFFIIFYLAILAYKLIKKEKFASDDIISILVNSFIFYAFGYATLEIDIVGEEFIGLFTVATAVVHFIVSAIIYKQELGDRNLFYLSSGLVLVFITIAVPVQLDGNWVTMLWIGEAALLFWIGRTKKVVIYESLSYPLILLALMSMANDWASAHFWNTEDIAATVPFMNIYFLTSVFFIGALAFMQYLSKKEAHATLQERYKGLLDTIWFFIPAILIFVTYNSIRLEIGVYWDQLYNASLITEKQLTYFDWSFGNEDILKFKHIWTINYTMLFLALISFVNNKLLKKQMLAYISLGLNVLAIAAFLMVGLFLLSDLREAYVQQPMADYFEYSSFHITIRYVCYVFLAIILFAVYQTTRQDFVKTNFKVLFDFLIHTAILWVLCSELIHLMDMAGSSKSDKLGLSILCGLYSLMLIVIGIWKKKKYLRIGAISLFGVTLVKLFLYDLTHLTTIAKTIVLVSLGLLLLIMSFLYNKYTNLIENEEN